MCWPTLFGFGFAASNGSSEPHLHTHTAIVLLYFHLPFFLFRFSVFEGVDFVATSYITRSSCVPLAALPLCAVIYNLQLEIRRRRRRSFFMPSFVHIFATSGARFQFCKEKTGEAAKNVNYVCVEKILSIIETACELD